MALPEETMIVYVLGGGGHAKVVIASLRAAGRTLGGVFDDAPGLQGGAVLGVPVLGTLGDAHGVDGELVVALGHNVIRHRIVSGWEGEPRWATVVHPHAWVHESVRLEPGAVVCAGAVAQPDASIGAHAIVNTGATVDHDCTLGPFVHVAPGAHLAGGVQVGEGAFLGTGSSVIPGVEVGAWATLGAGAVAVRSVPPNVTAVGVPARPLRERQSGWPRG
jgi:sugar O-acyltransferase (sialic acid O-acetyltransferase NeuD family)